MACCPGGFELILFAKRVHGLPEPIMSESDQLAMIGKVLQRLTLPDRAVASNQVEHARIEYKEATIDEAVIGIRFLVKGRCLVAFKADHTETSGWMHHGHGGELLI